MISVVVLRFRRTRGCGCGGVQFALLIEGLRDYAYQRHGRDQSGAPGRPLLAVESMVYARRAFR